jgi:DNA-binding MarR family transcriptional regulator
MYPTRNLDEIVHQRHRLGILTLAAESRRVEFGYLQESLELTAGNLSRHITVLAEAGLVEVDKGYEGKRPRTWIRITQPGRTALAAEMAALGALVRQHESSRSAGARRRGSPRRPASTRVTGSKPATVI